MALQDFEALYHGATRITEGYLGATKIWDGRPLVLDFGAGEYWLNRRNHVAETDIIAATRSSTATYFDAAGVMRTAAVDVPRFDHDPVTHAARGLLIEDSRTNLILNSEDFAGSSWSKTNSSVTANTATAPDGAITADTFSDDGAGGAGWSQVSQNMTLTAGNAVFSIFAKSDKLHWLILKTTDFDTTANGSTFFDLSSGTVGTVSANHANAKIVDVGGGWYRCSIEFTTATDLAGALSVTMSKNGTFQINLRDGTNSIIIWGAQSEVGTGVTSYIPTAGAATTRAADTVSVPDMSWYSDAVGTMVIRGEMTRGVPLGLGESFVSRSGSGSFSFTSSSSVRTSDGTITINAGDAAGVLGHAVKWTGTTMAASLNGAAVVSAAYDGAFGAGSLELGQSAPAVWLRRLVHYPVAVSDAALQSLSTV